MKTNYKLINHERIHLRQQLEMLIIPFYICYVTEYFMLLARYKDKQKAYHNISFEREAYSNDSELNYLKTRPFFNFINYFPTDSK